MFIYMCVYSLHLSSTPDKKKIDNGLSFIKNKTLDALGTACMADLVILKEEVRACSCSCCVCVCERERECVCVFCFSDGTVICYHQ